MRKFLALVLAAVMVLGVVPALADDPYVYDPADYASQEKYHLTWATYLTTPPADDAKTTVQTEDMFNVDIEILPLDDSTFMEVLNTYIMGGDSPDVMRLKDPGSFTTYVDQGVLGEIDMELVKEHFPIYYNAMMEYQDGAYMAFGAVDGKQYGLPALSGGNIFHLPIVYNKTWMDAVGVTETPKTLDEFYELMKKFANEDPDGNGVKDTYGISSDGLRQLFGAYGINPGAPDGRTDHSAYQIIDGKVQYAAISDQYREALRVAHQWYEEGLIDPEFITGENTGGYWAISNSIINHRIGCTVRGNYYHWVKAGTYQVLQPDGSYLDVEAGAVRKEWDTANPGEELVFGDPVTGPYGCGVKSWNLLAQIWAFPPEVTEDTDKFCRILDIMNYWSRGSTFNDVETMQHYNEDLFGEEGDYWMWQDKDKKYASSTQKWTDEYGSPVGSDPWGLMYEGHWGPSFVAPMVDPGSEYAYSLGYDKNGINTLVEFSLPSMAVNQTAITNLKDNWMVQFITGDKDIENDWDAYINEMNATGLEAMTAEVVEWYEGAHAAE